MRATLNVVFFDLCLLSAFLTYAVQPFLDSVVLAMSLGIVPIPLWITVVVVFLVLFEYEDKHSEEFLNEKYVQQVLRSDALCMWQSWALRFFNCFIYQ